MRKRLKVFLAAFLLSISALTTAVVVKATTEENVSALVNCTLYGPEVTVRCSGDSGVCVFHMPGADHVCLGSANAEVPSVPVEP